LPYVWVSSGQWNIDPLSDAYIYAQVTDLSINPEFIDNTDYMKIWTAETGAGFTSPSVHVYETPEPATFGLLAWGVAAAYLAGRRRCRIAVNAELIDIDNKWGAD
jgi:hypothetical protein